MISDIAVHLPLDPSHVPLGYAVSVAAIFDAHLSGIVLVDEFPAWATADGVIPGLIDQWSAEQQAKASKVIQTFENFARANGLRHDSYVLGARAGDVADRFAYVARSNDIVVIAQAPRDDDAFRNLLIEAAIFQSGRPVLIIPFVQKSGIKLERVMVCWDGSRNAARAIGDAMPFLERAQQVSVITIETKELPRELSSSRISAHLARHRINVEMKTIPAREIDAANIILNEAANSGATLIVMGGYGHTRFRELVLGGVTRSMLQSMTVPVLMAH